MIRGQGVQIFRFNTVSSFWFVAGDSKIKKDHSTWLLSSVCRLIYRATYIFNDLCAVLLNSKSRVSIHNLKKKLGNSSSDQ